MKEGGPPLLALATTVGHEVCLVLGALQSVRSHISTAAATVVTPRPRPANPTSQPASHSTPPAAMLSL